MFGMAVILKVSSQYSLSLMRLTVQAIQNKLENIRLKKDLAKNKLFSHCHKILADDIIGLIRVLNQDLFDFLASGKK